MAIRSAAQRKSDALKRLGNDPNVWLATADDSGTPHLIPLSLAWDGVRIVVATPTDSPTVRNARGSGRAKATLDSADDVVLIEATVAVVDFEAVSEADVKSYVSRAGWDPSEQAGHWSLLILTPRTVRAWNGVAEIQGRTIMRQGVWLA